MEGIEVTVCTEHSNKQKNPTNPTVSQFIKEINQSPKQSNYESQQSHKQAIIRSTFNSIKTGNQSVCLKIMKSTNQTITKQMNEIFLI